MIGWILVSLYFEHFAKVFLIPIILALGSCLIPATNWANAKQLSEWRHHQLCSGTWWLGKFGDGYLLFVHPFSNPWVILGFNINYPSSCTWYSRKWFDHCTQGIHQSTQFRCSFDWNRQHTLHQNHWFSSQRHFHATSCQTIRSCRTCWCFGSCQRGTWIIISQGQGASLL